MISGSCIGIGMLAIPISTSFAGFIPALLAFIICWVFMLTTAFYLADASDAFPNEKNLISLAGKILGNKGKYATWITFTFLFYCLLVAYIYKGGSLVQTFLVASTGATIPDFTGALVLTLISAAFVYWGTFFVDRFNAVCMVGLVLSYALLILLGKEQFSITRLTGQDWTFFLFILPFIIPAFGFHNLLPTLKGYMGPNKKQMKIVILIGSGIPLIIYTVWVMSVHGILPKEILLESFAQAKIATEVLSTYGCNPLVSTIGSYFAFFAIITSLLTQSLSVVDFFMDGFKLSSNGKNRFWLILLIFLPSLFFSQLSPQVFFLCLEWAGGVATMILFGLLPSAMVWKTQLVLGNGSRSLFLRRVGALSIMAFSCTLIAYELIKFVRN